MLRRLRAHGTPPLLIALLAVAFVGVVPRSASAITRRDFPEGFVFGAGSSAFQVEGAAAEDGRTPSIWDTFTHEGYSFDGSTADVSADQYHHYKEDVKLMHGMGLDAYRFSIAWPRLIPGIQPHVTIYHFDLPQVLQDEYGGLLSPRFMFMHPLVYGDYPPVMRSRVGERLPRLSVEESARVRGSFDFVGFNHYLILRIRSSENEEDSSQKYKDYYVDAAVQNPLLAITEGRIESPPWALGKLLDHLKVNYGNPPVFIHENGLGDSPGTQSTIEYDDEDRTRFLQDYLEVLYQSTRNGSDARGYFVWSFLDVFEFLFAYKQRFGLCGVDMDAAARTRYVRSSARWYAGFLRGSELRPPLARSGRPYDVA
ncbi:hypothetical protein HU200_000795 [Digitaria exilis]|uniref:Beta-glucosidase n=1 Tax=Digitaria exilis TaxID=1010633 RepID=A0A835G0Q8_9POAL|nr:hypothetical protein HU200_000795 [Digitaria exilis]